MGRSLPDSLTDVTDQRRAHRRATEMDITMIGLQNAGKTSLLRVLAVSALLSTSLIGVVDRWLLFVLTIRYQGGEFTIE